MYSQASFFRPGWKEETIARMQEFARERQGYLAECTRAAHLPRDLYREMGWRGRPPAALHFLCRRRLP